jgi:hypothetical protein
MKTGDLIKHITQDKWGIILETVDYRQHASYAELGVYCHILWNDEEIPWWIWHDMVKVVENECR